MFTVGPKLHPALANDAEPSGPPRFTRRTAERISDDLADQSAGVPASASPGR